jgi:hypothetical protein
MPISSIIVLSTKGSGTSLLESLLKSSGVVLNHFRDRNPRGIPIAWFVTDSRKGDSSWVSRVKVHSCIMLLRDPITTWASLRRRWATEAHLNNMADQYVFMSEQWLSGKLEPVKPITFYELFDNDAVYSRLGFRPSKGLPRRTEEGDVEDALDSIPIDELTSTAMVRALRFHQAMREKAGMKHLTTENLHIVRDVARPRYQRNGDLPKENHVTGKPRF